MSEKFTPGPWRWEPMNIKSTFAKGWREIRSDGGRYVVGTSSYRSSRDGEICGVHIGEADAQLIAAAPDLYAACQAIVDYVGGGEEFCEAVAKVRAALAKAQGTQA